MKKHHFKLFQTKTKTKNKKQQNREGNKMDSNLALFTNIVETVRCADDGKEYQAEILDSFGLDGEEYVVCLLFENEEDLLNTDVINECEIFKVVYGATEEEDCLSAVPEETIEYNKVYTKFAIRNGDKYDFV